MIQKLPHPDTWKCQLVVGEISVSTVSFTTTPFLVVYETQWSGFRFMFSKNTVKGNW